METLMVAVAALIAMVLIDAGYWIAVSLMRWAPVITAGLLAAWLASSQGLQTLHAIGVGMIVSIVARRLLRPRDLHDATEP